MDDVASRFWDKYILKTTSYNVPERERRWYVRHAEIFIEAQSGRHLTTLTADDIERYLKEKGRSEKLTDWQFRHLVDALRILFIGVVSSAWAAKFDWCGWQAGTRELPADHATIAKRAIKGDHSKTLSDSAPSDKAVNQFRLRFPELYSRFTAVIRGLQYSIRTEKTYLFWVARFVLHGRFRTADEIQPDRISPYLEHLAVNRNVAPNTQSVALNALIFFYKHILKLEVEGKLDYKRATKPRRLPVVLSVDEIDRLLSGINNTLYRLMASLLYGSGLRLMECIRLRICDLDFDYKQIVVRDGKGKKDRVVPMPESLVASLKEQLEKVRSLHDEDLEAGYGEVHLPNETRVELMDALSGPVKSTVIDGPFGSVFNLHRIDMPDFAAILADGAVRGEAPTTGCVKYGHPRPGARVAPDPIHLLLTRLVGGEIGHDEVLVTL